MMRAVGKSTGRFIIGSGRGVNPGRIAGGAPILSQYKREVFAGNVYPTPVHGNRPGGLIDKIQQQDPSLTTFGHPFDGGDYRSTATLDKVAPRTGWGVIQQFNPLVHEVPEIMPQERAQFLVKKVTPNIKTQFGANKTGLKSDTPFHPQVQYRLPPPRTNSAQAKEKVTRKEKPPSFNTVGNLWGSANHSYIGDRRNPIDGSVGVGRWQTVKRSAV